MKVLGFIALVIAGAYFALSVISGGFPHFYPTEISALHSLDAPALSLLVLLFPALYVPLQLVVGFLLDRYGSRTTMMAAAALAGLGLVLSVAIDIPAIGATGRALHALGASFAFVGGLYIAARTFGQSGFASLAGCLQAVGFGAIAWWYFSGESLAALVDFPRRYFLAAAAAVLLALLFVIFAGVKPVQDGADRPGFFRQLFGEIGSVLIRPRLWIIVIAAAFTAVPLGLYAPIWIADSALPALPFEGVERSEITILFVVSFALGSLLAGFVGDAIGRRRGVLFVFQIISAGIFALLAFLPSVEPIFLGALLASGGFFSGSSILLYALGNDRAPPHHAGLFLALIHAGFVTGAAGSVYAASLAQPLTDIVDLTQYFAPICLLIAAVLVLITPDKGPMAIAGPVADWEKNAAKEATAVTESTTGKEDAAVDDSSLLDGDAAEPDAEPGGSKDKLEPDSGSRPSAAEDQPERDSAEKDAVKPDETVSAVGKDDVGARVDEETKEPSGEPLSDLDGTDVAGTSDEKRSSTDSAATPDEPVSDQKKNMSDQDGAEADAGVALPDAQLASSNRETGDSKRADKASTDGKDPATIESTSVDEIRSDSDEATKSTGVPDKKDRPKMEPAES